MEFSFLKNAQLSSGRMLKAQITDLLRNAIVKGKLKPGQQLQQDKIAAALGVSSIPVREAFSALTEERHLVYFPNRGNFVSEIDIELVRETFEIRYFLECGALSIALPRMEEEDFLRAEEFMGLEDTEVETSKRVEYDLAFHYALCQPCNRPNLLALIKQINSHVERYINVYIEISTYNKHPEFNHKNLLRACRSKQLDEATKVLKHHLDVVCEVIAGKF